MQDKRYIFNSSIKLLKEAAKSLENNTLLSKIEELEKDYNTKDEDITLPLLASTLLFCEGLTDNNYLYDMVEKEVLDNTDPFNLFYNDNGVLLVDEDNINVQNSLDFYSPEDVATYDNKFKSMVWNSLQKDTMNNIRNKSFVDSYLLDLSDSEIMDSYIENDNLRDEDPDFNYTDSELRLIDRITFYRYYTMLENCEDKEDLDFLIDNLCDDSYSVTNAIDDNDSLYTNGELDLSKLIVRVRNGLAHNNYEEYTRDYIKIYHESNNAKDANFLVDNKFICYLVFKLLESVDKSIISLKNADKKDTRIKKNYMYLLNPKKKDYFEYLRQYPTLSERDIDSIYWEVKYKELKDTRKIIEELDKVALKKIKDRLPDEYVVNYLKSFNALSDYEISNIMNDLNNNRIYMGITCDRASNDPYKDQFKWINNELSKRYNYVHSYPRVLLDMIRKNTDIDEFELMNYEVFDGNNMDIPFSKYKLCINSVLHLMFVGNDQEKKRIYEFPDLFNYIDIHPTTRSKYLANKETITFMNSQTNKMNKAVKKKQGFLVNLAKAKAKGNVKAEEAINNCIINEDNIINEINKESIRYETEYFMRHLRNAMAHGNISYYPFSNNGELDAHIYLSDYDENGVMEFSARTTLNQLIDLVFSDSYTNEVLHINKKGITLKK